MTAPGAVRDEVELFGGPAAMFGCRHLPGASGGEAATAGVLVCSSVGPGAAASYGAEARLGRALARAGVTVQRFHYRGTGASDGAAHAIGFAGLVDDAREALDLLRARRPARVAFVGVRLGALVACRLAAALDDAPVALWSPVLDPRRFLTQAVAARPASRGSVDDAPTTSASAPDVDVFAMPLAGELLDGAAVAGLGDELGARPRDVLVLGTDDRDEADGYDALVRRWQARGLRVDVTTVPTDGERDGLPVPVAPSGALVARTTAWLADHLLGLAGRAAHQRAGQEADR